MFYDLVYSQDDSGWYAQAFDEAGKTAYTTKIYKTAKEAENEIHQKVSRSATLLATIR